MSDKKNVYIIAITLILLGFFLRIYQLNFENYWLDEIIDFWVSEPGISLKETFLRREEIDDQTPYLFQLILKMYFELFDYDSEKGRHVPLFFGILSIPFLGILSYHVKKDSSFLLTILLVSLNIYLIKYSQETRAYTLVFLLSIINLIFYYKIISLNLVTHQKIYIFFLFIIISVLSLSTHPFVLTIFFSQIIYFIYLFVVFKRKNYLFLISIPFILFFYFFLNYDYLIAQLEYKEYFLGHENWKFYYNFYFSRFFGSKIMGLIYLSTLIFLIINFRKKIFLTENNYLLLIFVLFFSYLLPLVYGYIKMPILTDRYIIYVLISIIVLISTLIFEINNNRLKLFLLFFIIFPTLINNFIEIKYRESTKPEFIKLLQLLENYKVKNLTLYVPEKVFIDPIEKYISSVNEFKKNNFIFLKSNNIPDEVKKFWVICYEPLFNFNCSGYLSKNKNLSLVTTKKTYHLNAQLMHVKN